MSLKSSKKVDTNRWQLEVAVDASTFNAAVDHAYKKQKNRIAVPGFRKGKAPRSVVEKLYGPNIFYEGAVNEVYPDALDAAVKEAKLDMIQDKIDFDVVSVDEKDGLVFKATITVKPEVTIDGYKGIKVTKKSEKVMADEVNAELKKVQERDARMVTVDDRPAAKDDIVDIDFDGSVDGKSFEGGKADNFSLTLGSGQFIPGFEDQIIGKNTGDEFDVNVTFPQDYHAEDLKGKEAVFKVKIHEIKVRELPELDDEFAKDVSEFDTLKEYKADVKKHLEADKKEAVRDDMDNQLIDSLVASLKGEIPAAMYANKANDDIRDFSYRLQSQGLDIRTYMKYTGMDQEKLRKAFEPQAERQVKVRLALEKIAEQEKLVASDEDIEKEYRKMADQYKTDVDKIKAVVEKEALASDLAVEKAIDFVRDQADVMDAPAEKKKKSTKATAAKKTKATKSSATKKAADKKDSAE
ncbi:MULTISPECIES: trigger factor [Caproicibacterium]|jgi:trigger factor|uniref:Trigger factor n=1 Tax=Caproicibacterium lactatifermentans TaxID=2666138 RepID=A0ABX6PXB1_9FIRM|nr:trigger factor [Caproicibacterium lactatifermentans]ARP50305.1 trigger factor [Ruminococcaceae bacterium CPB6]QKO30955.1 trigger factor [Caproicibacterium lactatifermentans]